MFQQLLHRRKVKQYHKPFKDTIMSSQFRYQKHDLRINKIAKAKSEDFSFDILSFPSVLK
jgi:hypothetical protein